MESRLKRVTKKLVWKAAKKGANSASDWHYYQPREPKALQKLKK